MSAPARFPSIPSRSCPSRPSTSWWNERARSTVQPAIILATSASDADVAKMIAGWTVDRARSFHQLVEGLEGQLRDGIDGQRAGALIRALSASEVYSELVDGEGWTPAAYEAWLAGLLTDVLLPAR